jgi:biotin carboxyl carrier protein
MEFEFILEDKSYKITLQEKEGKYLVGLGNSKKEVTCELISPNCLSLEIDGNIQTVYLAETENKRFIFVQGNQFILQEKEASSVRVRRKEEELGLAEGKQIIHPPMPGKILKILVSEGEKVKKKQSLLIVEAMKMEHEIKSALDGVVKKINFKEDQMVDTEDPIMELESEK